MVPLVCHLLPHEDADGPSNMARDEAMLDHVMREPGSAVFRTYGWTEPTLSIGYFQKIVEAESDPRWGGVPVVRRPTGGGAIWHHHELTYALALPRSHPLSRGSRELYRVVHAAISGLLTGFGVDARRRGEEQQGGTDPRPFLCFKDQDAEDIVIGPIKIVGSSQRRRAGVILQHGSLLLLRSPRAPELLGAADLHAISGDGVFWSEQFRLRLPDAIGLVPKTGDWMEGISSRARDLENSIFRNPGWTRRR